MDELLITADVHTRNEPSVDEFISRVEGTKVYGMDDVLSHHAERQRQAGTYITCYVAVDYLSESTHGVDLAFLFILLKYVDYVAVVLAYISSTV